MKKRRNHLIFIVMIASVPILLFASVKGFYENQNLESKKHRKYFETLARNQVLQNDTLDQIEVDLKSLRLITYRDNSETTPTLLVTDRKSFLLGITSVSHSIYFQQHMGEITYEVKEWITGF